MALVGTPTPRLSTTPLRPLTPETTLGFEFAEFCRDVLETPLLPWQKTWAIRAFELAEDGRFRYSTVLTLVARQNGKSMLLRLVALYFLFLNKAQLVLGAAQSRDIAKEIWQKAVDIAEERDFLAAEIESVRYANGEEALTLSSGARYRICAANRGGGRGLSVDLLVLDELREWRTNDAWSALSKTTMARPNSITLAFSNAGDDESVVLNRLRGAALASPEGRIGLLEWSAEDGCELDDRSAWAAANPALGHLIREESIAGSLESDPPATFRTEVLCQRVESMNNAIDPNAWNSGADADFSLERFRDRLAVAVDASWSGRHVSLVAAAELPDGRIGLEVLRQWSEDRSKGLTATAAARAELPELLAKLGAKAIGWYPGGPAAELASVLERKELNATPIRGADLQAACMEFAGLVAGGRVVHGGDPLLNAHVLSSEKKVAGDGWRFGRNDRGSVDAAYAAAGAVRLLLTAPEPERAPSWSIL